MDPDPDSGDLSREAKIQLLVREQYVMPNWGHYHDKGIRWSQKERQAAISNKGCSKCGQLHPSAPGYQGKEYNLDIVVNGNKIKCICPTESCNVFCGRTGLKPNPERAEKIKQHRYE